MCAMSTFLGNILFVGNVSAENIRVSMPSKRKQIARHSAHRESNLVVLNLYFPNIWMFVGTTFRFFLHLFSYLY